ncbi:glutamate-ammonia-ligase adenylyltransferase [Desulfurobacterium pacificum]|uniref:Glutamate-ammonia-ligase adenylyltransferase n=1 Tax=Desulfurobacterium pacificum TaxID=240166 RepID=A0ABY1N859_9BACT|nr:glutamate-ammonia-ligase adenylyltransferase [Desulfurobacterium pacificum]SMP02569.1 glutamate-ammonia-ligase adenylyltransferase [Desulfurobacterium pacificum]
MNFLLESLKRNLGEGWEGILSFVERETLPSKRRALLFVEKLANRLGSEEFEELGEDFVKDVVKLASYSQFLGDFIVRHPELLKDLKEVYRKKFLSLDFSFHKKDFKSEKEFLNALRIHKHFHMCRIVLRDILSLAPFEELVRDVTIVHDVVVKEAYLYALNELVKRYGEPSCGFVAVAMGKAAGFELNYSSDLDLIYVYYTRRGETKGGTLGKLQNHDFFTLLSNRITEILSKQTEEGVCAVVDTRLRPNGTMGPACNDIEALEQYYTAVARPWERFALLKSRPAAGDLKETGVEFVKLAKAFVFRKYVDLTLIEEVLRLKEKIKAKVRKKGEKIDLKLGEGGIREVEFIVQAFQLIYGGKYPFIRAKHTLTALRRLRRWGFLRESEYRDLRDAYLFLRRCEHMLQITYFRQTQTFHPESEEAEELAVKMGFPSREKFLSVLKNYMERVNYYFNRFFPTGDNKPLSSVDVEELKKMGFREPEEVKRFIDVLLHSRFLSPSEINRLDVMGKRFLEFLYEAPNSKNAMKNLISFLEREEGRVFFFSILTEIHALKILFFLLSTKEFFIKRFRETPEIVDFMFEPAFIENGVLKERIGDCVGKLSSNLLFLKNLFEVVAVVRYYLKRTEIEEFLLEFTEVADYCIDRIYDGVGGDFSLASVGKHGSREMNVGSDIDLLFFTDSLENREKETEKALKLIGELESLGYEVDTRLRPFGEKGDLIFTVDYFERYTKEVARLWEKLAFTRFRFLNGRIKGEVEKVVEEFLFSEPFTLEILEGITSMRKRLESELGKGKNDIKYGRGGIVDLEFVSYTYQLFLKEKIGNTFAVLKRLAEERADFSEGVELYRELRKAEFEKRVFGEFIEYGDKIASLKERARKFYEGFVEWVRERISTNIS